MADPPANPFHYALFDPAKAKAALRRVTNLHASEATPPASTEHSQLSIDEASTRGIPSTSSASSSSIAPSVRPRPQIRPASTAAVPAAPSALPRQNIPSLISNNPAAADHSKSVSQPQSVPVPTKPPKPAPRPRSTIASGVPVQALVSPPPAAARSQAAEVGASTLNESHRDQLQMPDVHNQSEPVATISVINHSSPSEQANASPIMESQIQISQDATSLDTTSVNRVQSDHEPAIFRSSPRSPPTPRTPSPKPRAFAVPVEGRISILLAFLLSSYSFNLDRNDCM